MLEPWVLKDNMILGYIYYHPSMGLIITFFSTFRENISGNKKLQCYFETSRLAFWNMVIMKKYQISLMQHILNYYYHICPAQQELCQLLQTLQITFSQKTMVTHSQLEICVSLVRRSRSNFENSSPKYNKPQRTEKSSPRF